MPVDLMSMGVVVEYPWLSALCAVGLALLCYMLHGSCARFSTITLLPVPPSADILWGHEKAIFAGEPGRALRRWFTLLGPTFRIRAALGAPDILVLSDPDAVSHILQKKIYDYHHSGVVRPRIARLLGRGLGWVEGEAEHKRMRQLVGPSLSGENIKVMAQDIQDAASRAFLHDFEGGKSTEAQQILSARRTGAKAITRYTSFVALMLLRRFPILNDLPIPVIQAHGLAKTTIQSGVAREMVRRNKDYVTGDHGKQTDLLSRLLLAVSQGKLSQTEMYDQVIAENMAGHDGTTTTVGFTIWELARNPDVQDRLRAELSELGREPTYEDFLLRLPYLDAVLREILRLYPALPYMERVATKPDVIPLAEPVILQDGTTTRQVEILPGQTVLIPIIAIHRLDSIWKEADEFRPERWLTGLPPQDKLQSGWSNLLAFSEGPRNCIGAKFAMFQYKVILCGMITRFRFFEAEGTLSLRISSSLQPWIAGRSEEGPQLPVRVEII
ncbi:cytochrome P450 [Fomitopsis serialis]|uniref:cytochrome P450 n=1 Tax=Fomitopsis serialis TaxID=139415 RepID=UPI0020084C37|nr:cytochrome P450 [Neoantrodia serialis]KAH9918269.1 cytochrome P450 [Neoantrodia serialis]